MDKKTPFFLITISHPWKKCFGLLLYAVAVFACYIGKIPCVFKAVFHVPCLGCGMSRAYSALLCGRWREAFFYHPMFWSMPIVLLYLFADGRLFAKKWIDEAVLGAIALGFIIQYVLKWQ